jgi:hypothetical protein
MNNQYLEPGFEITSNLDFVHLGNGGQQYVVANQDLTATY